MKKLLLTLPLITALAACETQTQSTLTGAALGAAIGSEVSGENDQIEGVLIGAVAGAAAGNYIGRSQSGGCIYQRPDGTRYSAAC